MPLGAVLLRLGLLEDRLAMLVLALAGPGMTGGSVLAATCAARRLQALLAHA